LRFSGTERATIELDGYFHPRALVIPRTAELELDDDGRARVSLFGFHVDDMRIDSPRVPLIRASYAELLWRVAVRTAGRLAWWVIACDLSSRRARYLAERELHYPVRKCEVGVEIQAMRCISPAGDLVVSLGQLASDRASPERRGVFTGARAEWEVPWSDDGSAGRLAAARVEADSLSGTTLGMSVTWAPVALVRTGRLHGCGSSRLR
jgi:hypothetical protein